jgi:hypothetical protein
LREIFGDGSCLWEELWEIFGDGRRVRTKKDWGIVFDDSGQGGVGTQVQGSGLKVRIPGLGLAPG